MTISKPERNNRGFTLVEVMISVFLVAATLVGLAAVTVSVMRGNDVSKMVTTATTMAKDRMESLKTNATTPSGYTALVSGGPETVDGIYARRWAVTPNSPSSGMKTIVVTVSWFWQGINHSVSLSTVVASPF